MVGTDAKKTKQFVRCCPICDNQHGEVLHTQRFALPDNHILPKSYDVVFCTVCGFVFADTTAGQAEYDTYYRDFSKYEDLTVSSGGGLSEWDKQRLQQTAEEIDKKLTDSSASILDIGCANGGLLNALRELTYHNLTGLDPSLSCVSYVSQRGIECFEGSLFNLDALPVGRKYDCIILTHVLEHVRDLKLAVDSLVKKTKPGGLVYIEVPDASRYSDFYIVPYHFFDCEHINHFDEHSLANLFLSAGCTVTGVVKKNMQVSSANQYPAVGLFLRTAAEEIANIPEITPNNSACHGTKAYIAMSAENECHDEIDALADSKEPIVVWGAGSYTLRLLETTTLGRCVISAFVDSDKSKQGHQTRGINIVSPQHLIDHGLLYPIVVCSALYSNDIVRQIQSMGIPNKIIIA